MNFITEEKFAELTHKFLLYIKCDRGSQTDYDLFTQQLDELGFCKARLQYEVSIAEMELKKTMALAYVKIKANPETFGLSKLSETAIKILMEADVDVLEKNKQLITSTYYYDRVNSLYSAMYSKRTWLEIEAKNNIV